MRYIISLYSVLIAITISPSISFANPMIAYTPLSDAARQSGQLDLYNDVPATKGTLELDDHILEYSIPKKARAYDIIPISYKLVQPSGYRRAAVEAVAFENPKKAADKPLYDLAIPGNMGVRIEYLGSVSADYTHDQYIPLTTDPKTPISPFPPFTRHPLTRSSTIRESDVVWFKFRLTNTGDTILDPEGLGGSFTCGWIRKIGDDGEIEWSANTENLYDRQLEYIYPGESTDIWVHFFCPMLGDHCRGLKEGNYVIGLTLLYKYHRDFNWGINIWHGKDYAYIELPMNVTKNGGNTHAKPTFKIIDDEEKMPGYLSRFEEFMTCFDIHQPVREQSSKQGTMYLQVAPWTKNAVIKLILTDPKRIAVAKVPIKVTDETLNIKYNPNNPMVIENNGKEEPAIIAMALPGMRTGFQLGPYPEKHMRDQIREMKKLGVNLISNTSGNWWIPELAGRKGVELHSASYKYWYDVLMREEGMKCLGWSVYPPTAPCWADIASVLLGRKLEYSKSKQVYGGSEGVDVGDPILPEVIAAWAIYNYQRWGDYWFKTKDGRVPIDIEDTWGWMRDDINIRYNAGPLAIKRFHEWVKQKYGTIDKINTAWNSNYKDFNEIDPEADYTPDGAIPKPDVDLRDHPFYDWSPAMEDWDVFRTELRMDIYRKANDIIRKTIPGAELALRTEGANLIIKSDPKSPSMHMRHVYYSQRRNALVYDTVLKEDVLHFHSDYTTLPYNEAEWRSAMKEMTSSGIVPAYLPTFNRMRDIVLQPYYGNEYQIHYNLDQPSKGMMIQCLLAAYPWWKATYEEGGAPGIIWADYLCDGFATETQKKEVMYLRKYMNKMQKP